MSADDVKAAEDMLKRVRRLKENLTCPNCGTMAPSSLGFTSICVKFKTFVCDLCKTSHQAISHRCKSVSMSTWTLEEVLDLTKQRLGGNQVARHVWLSKAPSCGGKYQGGGFLELSEDCCNYFVLTFMLPRRCLFPSKSHRIPAKAR